MAHLSVDPCSCVCCVIRAARTGSRSPVAWLEAPPTFRWPQLGRRADLATRPEHDPAGGHLLALFPILAKSQSAVNPKFYCSQ